jgi:hypothetical protein
VSACRVGGDPLMWEIILPNGDTATCESWAAAQLAAETLIEDARRYLRENLVVKRDGELDPGATAMLQAEGMLV